MSFYFHFTGHMRMYSLKYAYVCLLIVWAIRNVTLSTLWIMKQRILSNAGQ